MKKNIEKAISKYALDISQAKENGYEGILVPLFEDEESISLNNIGDDDYIYDLSLNLGWDRVIVFDFMKNNNKLINLRDMVAA